MVLTAMGRLARVVVLLALPCAASAAVPPGTADAPPPGATQPVALPATLTPESARELLSRLSDQQVRALLLEQPPGPGGSA